MPIQKLVLTCIVFASALLGSVLAADKPAAQSEVDKLQEQVRTLDKELAVQREAFVRKLDDVEKRQNEITAQQANSLAAISNQTATIGNHITNTSILITVLVLGAGFITYFSAKSRAEKEARESSKQWFDENTIKLTSQIETLKAETETIRADAITAAVHIKNEVEQVTSNAAAATEHINASVATAILSASKASLTGELTPPADSQAVQVVTEASQSLRSKPESQFTAEDFLARGLSHYLNRDFHAALSAFDNALLLSNSQSQHEFGAQLLIGKGITLGQLDKSIEAIVVFDELNQRFGSDPAPAVRDLVANGVINKGFMLHRLDRFVEAIAVYDELDRVYCVDVAPAVREVTARGLFYKSAALIQLDKSIEAISVFDELDRRFSADTSSAVLELVASGILNKGFTLSKLGKLINAIAVYELLDQRFGANTNPALREQVAKGLSGAGFNRILLAKQNWAHGTKKLEYLTSASAGLKRVSLKFSDDNKAMVLGNLGYSLFLAGESQAAEAPTLECLRLGGQKALEAQRKDATLHRVEPEDSQYEVLLNRLWQSLPPKTVAS